MNKFKLGDEVKILNIFLFRTDGHGIPREKIKHGSAFGGHHAKIVDIYEKYFIVNFYNSYDKTGEMQLGYEESNLELIKSNESSCNSINKTGGIMSNITTFVKNLALSANEKLLRKHGFRDSCGVYTADAKEFALIKLCKSYRKDMVEIAKGLEAELEKNK